MLTYIAVGFLLFLVLFLSFLAKLIYSLCPSSQVNLKKACRFYEKNRKVSDIVISLTTMPRRLKSETFKKVIECMLMQSFRAKEIRINVPYTLKKTGERYVIPRWLSELPVTIHRCKDYGPATKYIPTLLDSKPDQYILVYDDDALMPADTISKYVKYIPRFPDACLTCKGQVLKRVRGRVLSKYEEGYAYICDIHPSLRFLFDYVLCNNPRFLKGKNKPKSVDIVYGGAGYLVRPKMFNLQNLTDYSSLPKEAFYVDDIVMSGNLARNRVQRIVIPGIKLPRVTTETAMNYVYGFFKMPDLESLWTNSNWDSRNNDMMIHYFRNYW